MRIEAVTVCVNYADFLAETLPLNIRHFDQMVIVTSPEDTDTQRVCELHNVQCVTFDGFGGEKGKFHKSRGINVGLQALNLNGWVCHLDADMALPAQTRQVLEYVGLDAWCLYGLDRHIIEGYDAWVHHKNGHRVQQELEVCRVHTDHYPMGARQNVPHHRGWSPIGFFQLWNPQGSGVREYPDSGQGGADRDDVLFSLQWPRYNRLLLPELIGWHLESERAGMGINWRGRRTPAFVPTPNKDPVRHLHYVAPLAAAQAAMFGGLIAALAVLVASISVSLALAYRQRTATPPAPPATPPTASPVAPRPPVQRKFAYHEGT